MSKDELDKIEQLYSTLHTLPEEERVYMEMLYEVKWKPVIDLLKNEKEND